MPPSWMDRLEAIVGGGPDLKTGRSTSDPLCLSIAFAPAMAMAIAISASPAEAAHRPHDVAPGIRKVVLMTFAPPSTDDAASIEDIAQPSEVASEMTRDFQATDPTPASRTAYFPYRAAVPGTFNPFLVHAVVRPIGGAVSYDPGISCGAEIYRPDFRYGAKVEFRRRALFSMMSRAACDHGIPVGLFDALVMQESRYNPLAVSPKGALGLTQLMPGTAGRLGVNPYAMLENLDGGARYLREQLDRFGRYDLALAAYNAGPGRVARKLQVPAIAETLAYVRAISLAWQANWRGRIATSSIGFDKVSHLHTRPDLSLAHTHRYD